MFSDVLGKVSQKVLSEKRSTILFPVNIPKHAVLPKQFQNLFLNKRKRQETPKVNKSSARISKSEPKDTNSEPKGTKREPKREPNGAKREANGTKRDPNVSQRTSQNTLWGTGPKEVTKQGPTPL